MSNTYYNPIFHITFHRHIVHSGEQHRRFTAKVSIPTNQSRAAFRNRSAIRHSAFCHTTSWTTWSHLTNRSSHPISKHRRNPTHRWRYSRANHTRRTRATATVRLPCLSHQVDRFLCCLQKILQWIETCRLCFGERFTFGFSVKLIDFARKSAKKNVLFNPANEFFSHLSIAH